MIFLLDLIKKKRKQNMQPAMKGLTCSNMKKMMIHQNFVKPLSQYDYYLSKGADEDILRYTTIQGKTFGEKYMESFAREWFKLDNRTSSGHDHLKNKYRIEQKASRFGANGACWKWQHIEMKHEDWDILLLTGLNISSIDFFVGWRSDVQTLIEQNVITGQGKKDKDGTASPQQAYWFSINDFEKHNKKFSDYFTEIFCEEDLVNYLNNKKSFVY